MSNRTQVKLVKYYIGDIIVPHTSRTYPEPYDPTADRTDRRLWEREWRKLRCPFVFYLLLSLLPVSFAFLSPLFSFVGNLLGFLLVGKDFAKRSRIVNFF